MTESFSALRDSVWTGHAPTNESLAGDLVGFYLCMQVKVIETKINKQKA